MNFSSYLLNGLLPGSGPDSKRPLSTPNPAYRSRMLWVTSFLAGLLLGLSFSPFPFPFTLLVFPGFYLFLRLADHTGSMREMAYYSFPGLLLWNLISTYWLMFATVAGGIAALLANSAIMTIPLMLLWKLRNRGPAFQGASVLAASVWTAYEFLHYRWDLSWPWLSLGYSFSTAPWLVQYISITGILGITFWIATVCWMFLEKRSTTALLSALLLPAVVSVLIYTVRDPEPAGRMEVAVLQPNYDSYLHLAGYDNPYDPLEDLLEYSSGVISDSTRAVFWPENAVMALVIQGYPGRADQLMYRYVREWDIPLITGSSFLHRYEPGQEPVVTRGTYGGLPYNIYNSALGFYPDGLFLFYNKAKLVPMVERLPFLHFFYHMDVFAWVDWGGLARYGKGYRTDMFDMDGYQVPALICYDSVYPDWVRRFVREGAAFLVVATNDGWWGNTSGHIQHFDYARLRAVETGRTVLRSANNGLSGVILANGDVAVKTSYWTRDRFTYDVPLYTHQTFYVRYGDWIGWMSLMLVLSLVVSWIVSKPEY